MEIIRESTKKIKGASLILGFFDGIHAGHREVISSGVNYAKGRNAEAILLTFKESPSVYFGKPVNYIYPREYSYKIVEKLGVDYVIENDFSDLVDISADNYLKKLVMDFSPISISTGFNYSFGYNKEGNPDFLLSKESVFGYKYLLCPPCVFDDKIISSTYIKTLIANGQVEKANKLLDDRFVLTSSVIKGMQLGRKLGYPTANMNYPDNIIKLPYGVYKAECLEKPAVVNWGVKPTLNGAKEGIEVHIIGFDGDLYGKNLSVKIIRKIREEKKFDNLEYLKEQIEKDIEECLK